LGEYSSASATRVCITNASEAYATCLTEARQAQRDADAGNEGNDPKLVHLLPVKK
jgi:hypothetical protein